MGMKLGRPDAGVRRFALGPTRTRELLHPPSGDGHPWLCAPYCAFWRGGVNLGCTRVYSRELLETSASSAAQRQRRMLGARSQTDACAWMLALTRQQVGFAAAITHARLRLARIERIGHMGHIAGRSGGDGCLLLVPHHVGAT